jgi:hypothetical protein
MDFSFSEQHLMLSDKLILIHSGLPQKERAVWLPPAKLGIIARFQGYLEGH